MPYKIVIPESPFYAIRSMLEPENWAIMFKIDNREAILIGYVYPEDGFTFTSEEIIFWGSEDLEKLKELVISILTRSYENFI